MGSLIYICLFLATTSYVQAQFGIPTYTDVSLGLNHCPIYDDPNHPVVLPDPSDCSKYYICRGGQPIPNQCPEYLFWSPLRHRCDYRQFSQCADQSYPDASPASVFYRAYPNDCHRFYEIRILRCPENYQWSDLSNRCELAQTAGCEIAPLPWNPFSPAIIPTAGIPLIPGNVGGVIESGFAPVDPAEQCRAALAPLASYLPYPGDCHKFIHCGPTATVLSCPGELYWDNRAMSCATDIKVCYGY